MARPNKPDADKRELVIRLRVTPSEKSLFWQNAKQAGLTPSDFLRGLAVAAKPARTVPTQEREALLKVLAELGKQGSNLNQIARAVNTTNNDEQLQGIDWPQLNRSLQITDKLKAKLMDLLQR